MTFVLC